MFNSKHTTMTTLRFSIALASLALVLVSGCSTTGGPGVGAASSASLTKFRNQVIDVRLAGDETMAALDQVLSKNPTDPDRPYARYSAHLAHLEKASKLASATAADMRAQGDRYFQKWERELLASSDPYVRQQAEQRQSQLRENFGRLRAAMDDARSHFAPWLKELQEIRGLLDPRFAIQGAGSAAPVIEKAKQEAGAAQKSLDAVIGELNAIATTLAPVPAAK